MERAQGGGISSKAERTDAGEAHVPLRGALRGP